MSDLRVDYDHLGELVQHLDAGLAAMGSEGDTSDQIADAAGDSQLGDKIRSFGSSWEYHRQNVQDTLTWLRKNTKLIHDQFESVDQQLAAGLTGSDKSSTNSSKTA
jgi:hypothetical protein